MSNEKPIAAIQGAGTLTKPLFSRGLLLEDEDLTAGVTYTRDLVRLMFRSLFGCGVICGLKVHAAADCHNSRIKVTVTKGLGLDCFGNPIEVKRDEALLYDPECKPFVPEFWVVACYRETPCRPKDATCATDEESQVVQTRAHGGYELTLVSARPKCACSCEPADETPPRTGDCCGDAGRAVPPAAAATPAAPGQPPAAAMQIGAGVAPGDQLAGCECYRKHYQFECDCDCGCKCIVIGKFKVVLSGDQLKDVEPVAGVVRYIRPALIGYEKCREMSRRNRGAEGEQPDDEQLQAEVAPQPA